MHASYYAEYPVPELVNKYAKRKKDPAKSTPSSTTMVRAATGIPMTYERLLEAATAS